MTELLADAMVGVIILRALCGIVALALVVAGMWRS